MAGLPAPLAVPAALTLGLLPRPPRLLRPDPLLRTGSPRVRAVHRQAALYLRQPQLQPVLPLQRRLQGRRQRRDLLILCPDHSPQPRDQVTLLRMGGLPEAWIAPPEIRELRELTRYRHKLVKARTSVKDQVHGVLANLGIPVTHSDIFGVHGQAWLDELKLPQPYAGKVASLRQLAGGLTAEIGLLEQVLGDLLAGHEGYAAIQQLPGIGPVLAAVIVAEIGDIRRFPGPGQLGSRAGLTPRHYESDTKVIRGHVTKQGSRMLRWAVTEAIQRQPAGTRPRQVKDGIIARRGKEAKNIAKVAAARELLTLVFYGMRDGHVRRALQRGQAA